MTFKQAFYLTRPHTLSASIAPVLSALTLVFCSQKFLPHWDTAVLCLLITVLAQIISNVANDLFDFKQGADGANRKGFKRPIATGELSYKEVLLMLIFLLLITASLGIALILLSSPWLLFLGVIILLGAIAYTGGPFPLAYHGLGEVMVFLFYGLAATLGTYFVQCGTLTSEAIALAAALGFANCNILVVNNLRDVAEDASSGKRTLLVRFGKELGPKLYLANLLLSLLLLYPFYSIWGIFSSGLYLIFMMRQYKKLIHAEGTQFNPILVTTARGVLLLALNAIFMIVLHYTYYR